MTAAPPTSISFETHPDRYRHWSLRLEGPVESACTGTLTAEFFELHVRSAS